MQEEYIEEYHEYDSEVEEVFARQSVMPEIEKNIIVTCLNDTDFRRTLVNAGTLPEYFDDTYYQYMFRKIKQFSDNHQGNINKDTFITMARQDYLNMNKVTIDGKEAKKALTNIELDTLLEKVIEVFDTKNAMDKEFLLTQSEKYIREMMTRYSIYRSSKLLEGEERDKNFTIDTISDMIKDAANFTLKPVKSINVADHSNFFRYVKNIVEETNLVKFKLNALNKASGGGLKRGSIAYVGATTNQGKSLHLISHAIDYAELGYNVLYISLELTDEEVLERVQSNLIGENFGFIIDHLKKEPEKFEKIYYQKYAEAEKTRLKGVFEIVECVPTRTRVEHIESILSNYENQGVKMDVLIVDDIHNVDSGTGPYVKGYEKLGIVSRKLTALAREKKLLVWSATQLSRTGVGVEHLDISMIAGSFETAQNCAFMYLFAMDELSKQYKCSMVKTRTSLKDGNRDFYLNELKGQCHLIDSDYQDNNKSVEYTQPFENTQSYTPTVQKNTTTVKSSKSGITFKF